MKVAFAGTFAARLEAALHRALAQRRIAGAVLDVWYRYPTGPDPGASPR